MLSGFTMSKSIKTVAIGNFDGIHQGHRQLLNRLDDYSAVVVIENNRACLTPGIDRSKYVQHALYFYHLHKIKDLSATEFIKLLQKDFCNLENVVIGYDFVFGRGKTGDSSLLENYFNVEVVPQFCIDGVAIHSRQIKQSLQTDYSLTKRYLGRNYSIGGRVIKGQGIGQKELVPTINIKSSYCLPKQGVYRTKTLVDNRWYSSVTFIGHRKTLDNSFAIETHLIGVDSVTMQCTSVVIEFEDFMRKNKKFTDLKELKKQIHSDIEAAKG